MAKSDMLMGVCTTVVMVLLLSGYKHNATQIESSPKIETESTIGIDRSIIPTKESMNMRLFSSDSSALMIYDLCGSEITNAENKTYCQ